MTPHPYTSLCILWTLISNQWSVSVVIDADAAVWLCITLLWAIVWYYAPWCWCEHMKPTLQSIEYPRLLQSSWQSPVLSQDKLSWVLTPNCWWVRYVCYTNLAGHHTLYLYIHTMTPDQKWEVHISLSWVLCTTQGEGRAELSLVHFSLIWL